jgi:hypothetical protein
MICKFKAYLSCFQIPRFWQDASNDGYQSRLFTLKAHDCRLQDCFRVKTLEIKGKPRLIRYKGKKRKLRAAVALTKRVNGIQFRQKMRHARRKLVSIKTSEVAFGAKLSEKPFHFRRDVFWVTEHAVSLGNPNDPELSSPTVDVLKQVVMNGLVVSDTQPPGWIRLICALQSGIMFERIKRCLVSKVSEVPEQSCARIAVGVPSTIVHPVLALLGMLVENRFAALFRGQSLPIKLSEHLVAAFACCDALNRTDFLEPVATEHIARSDFRCRLARNHNARVP